ncbi:hypothetical protein B0H21DRAFT_712952 [Amylocystis lapponica]|nr:hypothetical protein B0H21DRAFT_712952 [Amylocystis lapponica]
MIVVSSYHIFCLIREFKECTTFYETEFHEDCKRCRRDIPNQVEDALLWRSDRLPDDPDCRSGIDVGQICPHHYDRPRHYTCVEAVKVLKYGTQLQMTKLMFEIYSSCVNSQEESDEEGPEPHDEDDYFYKSRMLTRDARKRLLQITERLGDDIFASRRVMGLPHVSHIAFIPAACDFLYSWCHDLLIGVNHFEDHMRSQNPGMDAADIQIA